MCTWQPGTPILSVHMGLAMIVFPFLFFVSYALILTRDLAKRNHGVYWRLLMAAIHRLCFPFHLFLSIHASNRRDSYSRKEFTFRDVYYAVFKRQTITFVNLKQRIFLCNFSHVSQKIMKIHMWVVHRNRNRRGGNLKKWGIVCPRWFFCSIRYKQAKLKWRWTCRILMGQV
jgi:hypothetical protein